MKRINRVAPWPGERMESYRWLDECLLGQPATEKAFWPEWQAYRYLLQGKMYAYIGVNDQNGRPIITLKLEPLYSDLLRQEHADIVPGYYMNKTHWSTAYLDGDIPKELLTDMVLAAYNRAFSALSKKAQASIKR